MPRIELIDEVLYGPNQPIHWEMDNLPLKNILRRQNLINLSLDGVLEQMRNAIGTQGSVSNRLNQSIAQDGSLKKSAIDDSMHSIESHVDTDNFVRMTKSQSDKLNLIASEATDVAVHISDDGTNFIQLNSGVIKILPSSTITPSLEAPNIVKFHMAFPEDAAHRHFYGLSPVHDNQSTPDYVNYKVNSSATPFIEGTLRVYINGVRIFEDDELYVPGVMVDDSWTLLSYTENHEAGTFELSAAIADDDIIKIDFDISFI